jgi:ABC-2 type transport system permease protein
MRVVTYAQTEGEWQRSLDLGRSDAAVRIWSGFAADVASGRQARVQVLVDGSNSNTASIVVSYVNSVLGDYAAEMMGRQMQQKLYERTAQTGQAANLSSPGIDLQQRVWFNPDLVSRNYFVPGVLANIVALVTLMLTALGVVREKEIGTMEQLLVTPLRPIELMLGKTIPFAIIGVGQVALVTTAALLVFQVPFRGSFPFLLACSALFIFCSVGVGLFISTLSRTQQQAIISTFFYFMPAFMFSGFAFPIRNMPEWAQWVSAINPVRYFMEIVRGVFLKGLHVNSLWPQMVALAVIAFVIVGFSAARFRQTLD